MKVICFDLDDTLYKEIDFLKSAYKEIVTYALSQSSCKDSFEVVYEAMLSSYMNGFNAFEELNDRLINQREVSEYLTIYRNHIPDISLTEDVYKVLATIKRKGDVIGLITDGRIIQQRNKIAALGLWDFISNENVVISEEFGTGKPDLANYQYFMFLYPEADAYIYVGDNSQKDFFAPNKLGWKTICIKDDGRNIHKQDFSLENIFLPQIVVNSLSEIKLF